MALRAAEALGAAEKYFRGVFHTRLLLRALRLHPCSSAGNVNRPELATQSRNWRWISAAAGQGRPRGLPRGRCLPESLCRAFNSTPNIINVGKKKAGVLLKAS